MNNQIENNQVNKMKISQFFAPLLKEKPQEAQIISHQLMLRAGMIRQVTSGIYNWLPLGVRVLNKISNIVRKNLEQFACQEIIMPTIQPANLWQESNRYDDYGKEMLRIKDRHNNDLLYGPTHEEIVTDLIRKNIVSYKSLPLNLYQIHWKFRDEIRPRFGVMRGREFLMKDAYSFDLNQDSAEKTYFKMFECYLNIFTALGVRAIPLQAETGAVGGSLSHEFHILADTGESTIYYDQKINEIKSNNPHDYNQYYAMADDLHMTENCPLIAEELQVSKGIEVGHIFYLGTKYSSLMKAQVTDNNSKLQDLHMGCYGIGVSRLVGAIIEANHDDNGIKWPKSVAPFDIAIIPLRNDPKTNEIANNLYEKLGAKYECLFDDSEHNAGAKFSTHDLIGTPVQIALGPRSLAENKIEVKNRSTNHKQLIAIDQIENWLKEQGF